MFYKNVSCSVKTFYGVTFNPGETKEVNQHINDRCMILADAPTTEVKEQKQPSSAQSKKEPPKKEEPKKEEPKTEVKPEEKPSTESAKS